eukprot:5214967-Pyramimonas_sp.AAC.2
MRGAVAECAAMTVLENCLIYLQDTTLYPHYWLQARHILPLPSVIGSSHGIKAYSLFSLCDWLFPRYRLQCVVPFAQLEIVVGLARGGGDTFVGEQE